MGFDRAAKTDPNSVVPEEYGGMWFLREELNTDQLGFTVLELEPGGKGKEHDESATDQEEIYYVVDGTITVDLAEETVQLSADEVIRLDPDETRQLRNEGETRAKLVLAGAPLS